MITGWIVAKLLVDHICEQLCRLKACYYKIIIGSYVLKESMPSEARLKNFLLLNNCIFIN